MNYNRYLDLHLCTNAITQDLVSKHSRNCFFTCKGARYFYEFPYDIMRQMRYRESKAEGFTFNENNWGNCRILNDYELTRADFNYLRFEGGEITAQLKQIRYISCMVAIENLATNTVYPQLQALMHWISDPHTVNKLRINCHGSGTATGGFSMGDAELSEETFIDTLVRHGLTRPSVHAAPVLGLAQGARWKADSEKAACENCNKRFGVFTRQHHCRRCGGLFCDSCSSKKADLAVALTGEQRLGELQQNATAKNVRKARVCDACYKAVAPLAADLAQDPVLREVFGASLTSTPVETGATNYGLKTMTLALCMGAKAGRDFSAERRGDLAFGPQPQGGPAHAGTFVSDSLAGRLLEQLRRHNLRGIKVAASNQVVASSDSGILAKCGIDYPTNAYTYFDINTMREGQKSTVENGFERGRGTFEVPAYIWGSRTSLRTDYATLALPPAAAQAAVGAPARRALPPRFTKDITVSPCGRRLYFSFFEPAHRNTVVERFLKHWEFTSWEVGVATSPNMPGGNGVAETIRLLAPPRVTRIAFVRGAPGADNNRISITGRETEYFKQYKSYAVS